MLLVKIFLGIFCLRIECWENIFRDLNNCIDIWVYFIYFYFRIELINCIFCDKFFNEVMFL